MHGAARGFLSRQQIRRGKKLPHRTPALLVWLLRMKVLGTLEQELGAFDLSRALQGGIAVTAQEHQCLADGSEYLGEWNEAGEKHGTGFQLTTTGDLYEGQFVHDQPHGLGRFLKANGEAYQGNFVQGKAQGYLSLIHI